MFCNIFFEYVLKIQKKDKDKDKDSGYNNIQCFNNHDVLLGWLFVHYLIVGTVNIMCITITITVLNRIVTVR